MSAVAVLAAGAAVRVALLSLPNQLRLKVAQLGRQVAEFEQLLQEQTAKYTAARSAIDTALEQLDDSLATIETKRRRVAAAESRRKRAEGEGQEQPLDDRAQLNLMARQRGIEVM